MKHQTIHTKKKEKKDWISSKNYFCCVIACCYDIKWLLWKFVTQDTANFSQFHTLINKIWDKWKWIGILINFLLPGFIMMTPQLFINYKLKSVAHLPWRMMTYKVIQSNLTLRNFLVTTKKFLKVKSSLFQIFNQSTI